MKENNDRKTFLKFLSPKALETSRRPCSRPFDAIEPPACKIIRNHSSYFCNLTNIIKEKPKP